MRLQLIVAALLLLASAHAAHAQTAFTSKLQVYADDDHTTVVSPLVRAQADLSGSTNVSAGYVADIVTSASIDVVSQASPTTIHDVRHQVALGASHLYRAFTFSGGYTFSTENDYLSNSLSAGASWSFDDKNSTLALGGGIGLNDVGRSGDHHFSRSLDTMGASLSFTQIFSPTLIGQVTYDVSRASGFQASPYRFVPVVDASSAMPLYWLPETDPPLRVRNALVLGANYYLAGGLVLQGDYRLYRDTWDISSHTVELRLVTDLGTHGELRLRARTYVQDGASFYRTAYTQVERYMAVDRELSPLWSETLGAKMSWKLADHLEGELKLDGFYYAYSDFPLLASRLGVNAGIGLQIVY
jgi:hypothetical protein